MVVRIAIKICENTIDRTAELNPILCIKKYIPQDNTAPIDIDLVKLISKFKALEKIILILDQTINGRQKSIEDVYVDTSLNSFPNKDTNISFAIPRKKKNAIGIEKDNKNTFLSFALTSLTSFFSLVFESSGNKMSKLAANSWKIISNILLDQARTPNIGPV